MCGDNIMEERNILCIDLKSFFAACECVDRGLDMFTTPLVVTDTRRGNGAITLAVTPFLKNLGVKSRGRLYELPKNIKIIYAEPRHHLYMKKSKEVFNIFKKYVSEEDLLPYSVDEGFLDVTSYLKMYKKTDYELAKDILNKITEKTGLIACCGIGPNMLLSKIALDTDSKHSKDRIAKWTYDDVKTKLWNISPLSDMWGIGKKTEKNLNNLGIKKIGDINKYDINFYKKRFGILGESLYLHANGIDERTIKSEKELVIKNTSYSVSHILFRDYTIDETPQVIIELCDNLAKRLRANKKTCKVLFLYIAYSKEFSGSFSHQVTLSSDTDDERILSETAINIFNNYVKDLPVRKVAIAVSKIENKNCIQLNLFDQTKQNDDKVKTYIDDINKKLGNKAIKKASSLVKNSISTEIER